MCEEMQYASKDAPKAIVGSVIIGFVVWQFLKLALTPDWIAVHPRAALLHQRYCNSRSKCDRSPTHSNHI